MQYQGFNPGFVHVKQELSTEVRLPVQFYEALTLKDMCLIFLVREWKAHKASAAEEQHFSEEKHVFNWVTNPKYVIPWNTISI